jgi:hypothetical protein
VGEPTEHVEGGPSEKVGESYGRLGARVNAQ